MKANKRELESHIAQIYKDCLYVYGKSAVQYKYKIPRNELWCFDMSKREPCLRRFHRNRESELEAM